MVERVVKSLKAQLADARVALAEADAAEDKRRRFVSDQRHKQLALIDNLLEACAREAHASLVPETPEQKRIGREIRAAEQEMLELRLVYRQAAEAFEQTKADLLPDEFKARESAVSEAEMDFAIAEEKCVKLQASLEK